LEVLYFAVCLTDSGTVRGATLSKKTVQNWINQIKMSTANTSWDYYLDDHHNESDISLEKVQNFIEMANRVRSVPITDDPLTVLQKYELLREGRITRAAFFLFMAGESSLSAIELGRFQTETIIKDGSRLRTDLFTEVTGVMEFIKKHINRAYIITGNPQREERWDYPLDAVREIVLNAVIHVSRSSRKSAKVSW
jgi:ATP-dependent DNA helicase RecG